MNMPVVLDLDSTRFLAAHSALRESARLYKISAREMQVVHAMLRGLVVSDIAKELLISDSTVVFHFKRLLKKTGASSRVHLAALLLGYSTLQEENPKAVPRRHLIPQNRVPFSTHREIVVPH